MWTFLDGRHAAITVSKTFSVYPGRGIIIQRSGIVIGVCFSIEDQLKQKSSETQTAHLDISQILVCLCAMPLVLVLLLGIRYQINTCHYQTSFPHDFITLRVVAVFSSRTSTCDICAKKTSIWFQVTHEENVVASLSQAKVKTQ